MITKKENSLFSLTVGLKNVSCSDIQKRFGNALILFAGFAFFICSIKFTK
jgi:hypothetical protein